MAAVTWEAAMRWALIRAADTGERYRVTGYIDMQRTRWAYKVGRA